MKILSFIEGARKSGGGIGIPSVPNICHNFSKHGHSILLICSGLPISGSSSWIDPEPKSGFSDGANFKIKQYPSLDDHWCFHPALYQQSQKLAKEADFILLHSLYSYPVLVGYLLARKYHKPYAIWPHGVLAPFQRTISYRKKAVYNKLFGNAILNQASMIVYTAQGERDEAESLKLKSPSVVIPLGFSSEEYSSLPDRGKFRDKSLQGHKGPVILFLGRINAKKGLDILIQAMKDVIAQYPEAQFVITGGSDPESFGQLVNKWIREAGIENNTVLTGVKTGQEKLEILVDADMLVLPSHAENFGFVVFEAMACGKPVVISETLNYASSVKQSGAGMVLPRDPQKFSEAIRMLLENPILRKEMGENGVKLVKTFSWQTTADRLQRAMAAVLGNKPFVTDLYAK